MSIASTTRKAGPFTGNGLTTIFPFTFKVFQASDLLVVRTDLSGIETTLTLTTDYTVSLNANQDSNPGGTITAISAPASGFLLAMTSNVPELQPVVLTNMGGFYPRVINDALDRLTIFTQQISEKLGRALTLPLSAPSGVSTQLPFPAANKIIAWNESANGLQSMDPSELATVVAFGTANADIFSGTGSQTAFTLTASPGALNNLDVSISGVTQKPGLDYTWSSGTTITFTSAPPVGTNNVLARYLQGLPQGSSDSASATFIQAGTGAVTRTAQDKMREFVSVLDFGAKGDFNGTTGTDDYAAIQAAINYLFSVGGGTLYFPKGFYRITQPLNLTGNGTAGRFGNSPIVFKGAGMPNAFDTGSWSTYGGSWIVGQTANWIMDCTGLQYFTCEEIGFRGTGTNASNKGVLCARSTAVQFAHNHYFKKCVIWIDSAPASTAVGSIAIANNGAETFIADHCWLVADTPLTLTFNNSTDLSLVSPYVTIGGPTSSTMMNFRNVTFFALTGYASRIQGANNVFFDTCIWSKDAANTTNYGIQLIEGQSGTAHNQDIRITGQIENFSGAVRLDDSQLWNIDLNVMMPSPSAAYISTGGVTMNNCKWNVHHMNGSTARAMFICSFATTMNGGEINVYAGGSVTSNSNLITYGTLIKGHNIDLSGSLGLGGGSKYLALGTAGVTINPPTGLAITPYPGNNSAVAASPNTPTSYLTSDGFIRLSGSFTTSSTISAGVAVGNITLSHRPNREVDGIVYIAGAIAYCRVLTTGDVYFGSAVTSGQLANIDGFSYKLTN